MSWIINGQCDENWRTIRSRDDDKKIAEASTKEQKFAAAKSRRRHACKKNYKHDDHGDDADAKVVNLNVEKDVKTS